MTELLSTLWTFLNSPAGIALIAGIVLWALNKVYAAKPAWAAYEGTIITAIRLAEQTIPDTAEDAGLAKLDQALKLVLKVFEEKNGRAATPQEQAALKEGIQIKHNELDVAGVLNGPAPAQAGAQS